MSKITFQEISYREEKNLKSNGTKLRKKDIFNR